MLEREGLTIAGVASNCAEALHKAEALRPDVVLVDISLGEESGFDVLRHPTIDRLTSIREPAAASVRRLIEVGSDRS